jgi:hypothetical protein
VLTIPLVVHLGQRPCEEVEGAEAELGCTRGAGWRWVVRAIGGLEILRPHQERTGRSRPDRAKSAGHATNCLLSRLRVCVQVYLIRSAFRYQTSSVLGADYYVKQYRDDAVANQKGRLLGFRLFDSIGLGFRLVALLGGCLFYVHVNYRKSPKVVEKKKQIIEKAYLSFDSRKSCFIGNRRHGRADPFPPPPVLPPQATS